MASSVTHNRTVFADNFQFHLQDQLCDCEYPETWNDEIVTCMLAIGTGVVGIGTVRDLDVDVEIEIFDEPLPEQSDDDQLGRPDELIQWDHVAQCTLDLPSGKLMLTGPSNSADDAEIVDVKPGRYGLRIFWKGLDSLDALGFEGDDAYKILMWPETEFPPRVLKIWRTLELSLGGML